MMTTSNRLPCWRCGDEQHDERQCVGEQQHRIRAWDAERLERLRERLALQWRTPVSIRIAPDSRNCSPAMLEAIPLMVHEATVNALKHAQPTQIDVVLNTASDGLHIIVSDNGRGFPFKGRYDHSALAASGMAPRSLFDRVATLGGRMVISSTERGSRVEMVVSP